MYKLSGILAALKGQKVQEREVQEYGFEDFPLDGKLECMQRRLGIF